MNPFDELQFVNELNLRNFRHFSGGYNFSCPLCNEGSSPWKRRGYLLIAGSRHDHNTYICHNCYPDGMSLKSFLRQADPDVYKKYLRVERTESLDRARKGQFAGHTKRAGGINTDVAAVPQYLFRLSKQSFMPARDVPEAVEYCRSRLISERTIDRLYYSKDLKNWQGERWPYSDMLIFPFWYDRERVYGFQGRSIKEKVFRTFSTNDSFKVYNAFSVDPQKDVYVFESIIDSMTVRNAIAMAGADLSPTVQRMFKKKVYVFDNDRTGIEKSIKYLEKGDRVFVWPNSVTKKDFNELLTCGATEEELQRFLTMNIKSGEHGLVACRLKLLGMKNQRKR